MTTLARSFYTVVFSSLLLMSCNSAKEPTFEKMDNVRVSEIKQGQVTLMADAVYFNPNPIGGRLEATDIVVQVNKVKVARINQELATEISANASFSIPVKAVFPLDEVVKNESDLISGVVSALLKKKIDVIYSGATKVRFAGIGFEVPVDYHQEVALNKK